ncbi:MAG: hypothetical protein U0527_07995 [Candidatus Eisenbacteria bacterium]
MPERRGPSGDLVERVRQALKLARGYYRERLLRPEGSAARAYLERREIGDAMAERFGLGVAPDAWDGLLSYARRFSPTSARWSARWGSRASAAASTIASAIDS